MDSEADEAAAEGLDGEEAAEDSVGHRGTALAAVRPEAAMVPHQDQAVLLEEEEEEATDPREEEQGQEATPEEHGAALEGHLLLVHRAVTPVVVAMDLLGADTGLATATVEQMGRRQREAVIDPMYHYSFQSFPQSSNILQSLFFAAAAAYCVRSL